MYLINATTIKLEWFEDADLPYYAILSHTWGKDEISLQEMLSPTPLTTTKTGYTKILGACSMTLKRYLSYIWIDTCCIDKTSSAALSEAINSMYRYYAEASTCYVYLEDVRKGDEDKGFAVWEGSRWWSRGWTLQELVAPAHVYFFAQDWRYLGTKELNAEEISRITRVPVEVLKGDSSPAKYSIAQRISWASRRETTRKEDLAYCLLGLLEVNMPLLYGEGMKAFVRLQEEVIKISADQSVFTWWVPEEFFDPISYRVGMLAESPAWFAGCEDQAVVFAADQSYAMTNLGLNIRVWMSRHSTAFGELHLAVLRGGQTTSRPILLQHLSANRYARILHDGPDPNPAVEAAFTEATVTIAQRTEATGLLSLAAGFLFNVENVTFIIGKNERNTFVFSDNPARHASFDESILRRRGKFPAFPIASQSD